MFLLKTLSQSKYLLSAMTGILLSSSAFAGTAGRVNFISGEVTATTTNNSTHTLYKGDLISAGDKLETGKNGRVQIRFTDGSILSLKPNSVFSIEKYNFSKDTPEQGNLLFNFIRGGFRTISGAIGKANRNNYGMNTPFATIGIRGTDYSAATSNGKVFVTVTDGQVNINNEAGDANANAGESYVIGDKTAPTRCHVSELLPKESVKKPTTPVIPEPCSPVIVPLEAEDGFLISTQKIKKPIQENYKNYGHYAEAMRQYTALLNEANQLTNEEISSLTLGQLANTDLTQTDINRNTALKNRPLADALDATEMRDASAINDFMQQYTALSLVNNIDAKDLLKPKQPNTISKDTVVNVIDNGLELKLNQIFESLFSSLVSTTTTNNFLGTDTVIIGADFGSPDIDVKFGTDRTDFLSVTLAPALRDKDELIGLGVLQPSVLAMDANSDNKLRGFSFRQGIMHDNDGIASNKNSGSLVIGDGSAQQSTVVFTDDTTPVSVKISLGDRTNTTINTESILEVKVKTPKLAIKVGDIYVSNSDSSAENIDKNGSSNLGAPEVLATGQDGGKLISIMGSAEIILGAANIGVKLEHHNDLVSRIIDGIYVIPSFSILADASIKDGLTINNLSLKDADGAIKGGVLKIGGLKVSDYNSNNLNAKLAINIEKPSLTSKSGGLLLTLKQLGDAMNGIDIAINNLSVGSDKASDIGDIQMIGLNIHGANLLLRGH